MKIIDKPLFWLYVKTRDSVFSSFKGFSSLLLVIIIAAIVSGNKSPENTFMSYMLYLLTLSVPTSMGLMLLKLKFRKVAGSIPRAELAYFLQSNKGIELENAVKGIFSLYLSLMIYLWFLMMVVAVFGPLILMLVL